MTRETPDFERQGDRLDDEERAHPKKVVPCVRCQNPTQEARWVYAHPTCYACLPPPEELPLVYPRGLKPDWVSQDP